MSPPPLRWSVPPLTGRSDLSIEELQQATGVSSAVMENLKNVGALGGLPDTSQVSFF